jgi:hypothetical protein
VLYHNKGDGTFEDVSVKSRITVAGGTYGLGVSTVDFDDDGWTDLYVANDSSPSTLYRNNHDGTFTDIAVMAGCAYSQDGKPQAGMGVAVGDYDGNGTMDIFKTNFAGDTSTLYANTGKGSCEDRTFQSGVGRKPVSGGASGSPIWIWMAGSIYFSSCVSGSRQLKLRWDIDNERWSIATWATAASTMSRKRLTAGNDTGRP